MKVVKLVGGVVFFAFMFSACYGQNQMTVLCSTDWLTVTVQPFLLNSNAYVYAYELHLGLGCPVNHIQPQFYQFTYLVTECGIRVRSISENIVIYSTEVHYVSKTTSSKYRYVIPVSCAAPKRSPWLTKPHSVKAASKNTAMTPNGEASHTAPSERPTCDCPPFVFSEEPTQGPSPQEEALEASPELPFYFINFPVD